MANAVLISIRPEWVNRIISGEKTVEIRKNRPSLKTPYKCYVYVTKQRKPFTVRTSGRRYDGRVVAEFICDKITRLTHIGFTGCPGINLVAMPNNYTADDSFNFSDSCLTIGQMEEYLNGGDGYAWHVSELEIYDAPKELNEFHTWKKCKSCSKSGYESTACAYDENCMVPAMITKAPQSWCFVEELEHVEGEILGPERSGKEGNSYGI